MATIAFDSPVTRNRPWQLDSLDWMNTAYTIKRRSCGSIGRELGCSPNTVWNALQRLGIPRRPPRKRKIDPRVRDRQWLTEHYPKLTCEEIGQICDCSGETVRSSLAEFGIETTRSHEETSERRVAAQYARQARERTKRAARELLRSLDQIEERPTPATGMWILLTDARRRGQTFDDAWNWCLDVTLESAMFAHTWRIVLEETSSEWQRAYDGAGHRMEVPVLVPVR